MISYGKQSIDSSDIDAIVDVLNGDWLTQGPAVDTFEDDLKKYFGSNHASAVANGTAALHLTGLALSWQPDDIVITSPITFLATANCIIYAGATPDLVDIDPVSYTIDPNQVENKIKAHRNKGKKVKTGGSRTPSSRLVHQLCSSPLGDELFPFFLFIVLGKDFGITGWRHSPLS